MMTVDLWRGSEFSDFWRPCARVIYSTPRSYIVTVSTLVSAEFVDDADRVPVAERCGHVRKHLDEISPEPPFWWFVPLGLLRGGHSKYDLRYTQKPTYFPIFTDNIWSFLLWSLAIIIVSDILVSEIRSRTCVCSLLTHVIRWCTL